MTEPRYPAGTIVEYPYLWRWQAEKGREHAEKHRPVRRALSIWDDRQAVHHMIHLPISGTPPHRDGVALQIPALELRRDGCAITSAAGLRLTK